MTKGVNPREAASCGEHCRRQDRIPNQGEQSVEIPQKAVGKMSKEYLESRWVEAFSESSITQQPFKATGQGESDA